MGHVEFEILNRESRVQISSRYVATQLGSGGWVGDPDLGNSGIQTASQATQLDEVFKR